MKQTKRKYQVILLILIGIILLTGVSYAWFVLVLNGTKSNALKAGNLSLILGEERKSITLENAYPILSEDGLTLEGYEFQVQNNGNLIADYQIYLDDDTLEIDETRIDPKYIRFSLDKDDVQLTPNGSDLLSNLEDSLLISTTLGPNATHHYRLRLWVDYDADSGAINKVFKGKLRMEATVAEVENSCFATNGNIITNYNSKDSDGNDCPKDVVIPTTIRGNTITEIGTMAFQNKDLTSVSIPSTVKQIGTSAFSYNKLTSISIPSSVTSIGTSAFLNNQTSDSEAFIYNRNLDGSMDYTSLNSYAGANRDNVIFPEGLQTIGSWSCEGLGLATITLPEGLQTIGGYAFNSNKLTSLTIPSTVTNLSGSAFANNQLNDEDAFIYKRNNDGSEDRSYLLTYAGARKESIIIPSNVTTIGDESFANCHIQDVTIPDSVVNIGTFAFRSNNLTDISIPSSVTHIGVAAFNSNRLSDEDAFIYNRNSDGSIDYTTVISYGGIQKENVVVPENVIYVSSQAFYNTLIKNIILPEGLLSIGYSAFAANELTSVTIPSSVTSIATSAFRKNETWNPNLKTIINQTGRSFNWGQIINGTSGYQFVTGTVGNGSGNVSVTSK